MTDETPNALIEELNAILDQEREALIKGELDKLEPLLTQKESLIGQLNSAEDVAQTSLTHVQGKVVRNQALLNSAMEGIKAVAARMADLRRVRKGLDVYNRSGTKTSFATCGAKALEKRA